MATGEQSKKPKPKSEEAPQAEATKTESSSSEEVDDLLDEIDSVLETNSEEFVRSFIQKGGEAFVFFVAGASVFLTFMQ